MTELPHEVIEGASLRLRPYRDDDVPDIALACNDPDIQRFLHQLPQPYAVTDAAWWVRVGAPAGWASGGAQYALADPVTDGFLGTIGLSLTNRERRQGEIGYWVAPDARGKGLARSATVALSAWANVHGFVRLELLTEPENVPSQRVAIAAGYRFEGRRRGAGIGRSGGRHDLTVWSRLADDPPGPTARLLPDLPGDLLTDGVVGLRPLNAGDADDAYRHRRSPDVVATSVPPVPPERDEVARRCAQAPGHWLAGERIDLVITDAGTGRYAGEIGIYHPEPGTGQAMTGYSVSPPWRGRGYAVRAVRLLAGWVFTHTRIARLVAGVDMDNPASQRVLEKSGFRLEGRERGRLPGPTGTRRDTLLYALLPGDMAGTAR